MNEVLTLGDRPLAITSSVTRLLAFLGIPSQRAAKQQLSLSTDELIKNLAEVLDSLVVSAIEKRSAAEFKEARDTVFPVYARGMAAVSELIRIVVPTNMLERLASESFCELETDFKEQGLAAFGAEVRDQAIFTVWTLRKMSDLLQRISAAELAEHLKAADAEFAAKFSFFSLWTRFHLDCLTISMRHQKPLYPETRELVIDGLRAAVNAYAWIRQGVDLRYPLAEPSLEPSVWDQEDQELLDSSMSDVLNESHVDGY